MSKDYFNCPNCGDEVPVEKPACPHCGSDAETGWNEDTMYDNVGLPEEEIYPTDGKPGKSTFVLKIIAWIILGVFLYIFAIR